jgi:hypothetical protein
MEAVGLLSCMPGCQLKNKRIQKHVYLQDTSEANFSGHSRALKVNEGHLRSGRQSGPCRLFSVIEAKEDPRRVALHTPLALPCATASFKKASRS